MKEKDRLNLLYFVIVIMMATAAVGTYSVRAYFEVMEMGDLREEP